MSTEEDNKKKSGKGGMTSRAARLAARAEAQQNQEAATSGQASTAETSGQANGAGVTPPPEVAQAGSERRGTEDESASGLPGNPLGEMGDEEEDEEEALPAKPAAKAVSKPDGTGDGKPAAGEGLTKTGSATDTAKQAPAGGGSKPPQKEGTTPPDALPDLDSRAIEITQVLVYKQLGLIEQTTAVLQDRYCSMLDTLVRLQTTEQWETLATNLSAPVVRRRLVNAIAMGPQETIKVGMSPTTARELMRKDSAITGLLDRLPMMEEMLVLCLAAVGVVSFAVEEDTPLSLHVRETLLVDVGKIAQMAARNQAMTKRMTVTTLPASTRFLEKAAVATALRRVLESASDHLREITEVFKTAEIRVASITLLLENPDQRMSEPLRRIAGLVNMVFARASDRPRAPIALSEEHLLLERADVDEFERWLDGHWTTLMDRQEFLSYYSLTVFNNPVDSDREPNRRCLAILERNVVEPKDTPLSLWKSEIGPGTVWYQVAKEGSKARFPGLLAKLQKLATDVVAGGGMDALPLLENFTRGLRFLSLSCSPSERRVAAACVAGTVELTSNGVSYVFRPVYPTDPQRNMPSGMPFNAGEVRTDDANVVLALSREFKGSRSYPAGTFGSLAKLNQLTEVEGLRALTEFDGFKVYFVTYDDEGEPVEVTVPMSGSSLLQRMDTGSFVTYLAPLATRWFYSESQIWAVVYALFNGSTTAVANAKAGFWVWDYKEHRMRPAVDEDLATLKEHLQEFELTAELSSDEVWKLLESTEIGACQLLAMRSTPNANSRLPSTMKAARMEVVAKFNTLSSICVAFGGTPLAPLKENVIVSLARRTLRVAGARKERLHAR